MSAVNSLPYTKTFSATGYSDVFESNGDFPVSMDFGSGAVTLERSLDKGATFQPVMGVDGAANSFTADTSFDVKGKHTAQYRFNCTSYTSGITCRAGA